MIKVQSYYPSYRNLDPSKVSRRVFGYGAEKMQEFMKRKNDTKENIQEVGPFVGIPPKLLWRKVFHENFMGFIRAHNPLF
jgi:hypothetical protein